MRSRCGWASVLRHSAACSSASRGVSLGSFGVLAVPVIVVLLYSNISEYQDLSSSFFPLPCEWLFSLRRGWSERGGRHPQEKQDGHLPGETGGRQESVGVCLNRQCQAAPSSLQAAPPVRRLAAPSPASFRPRCQE